MGAAGAAEWNVNNQLECLALNVYFEARGEPREGQVAVAHVVMNRVA
ncbi:MAG: cell wall hydrolase, partial [Alphaproteobacteria bacterium]|nr:cell wall hydrolase [Alphaproteobacteria bacterium]